jgi:hypothetical protein
MKTNRLILILSTFVVVSTLKTQGSSYIKVPNLITTLEKEYTWNPTSENWELSALLNYRYNNDGFLSEIIKTDYKTGTLVSLVTYEYNLIGLRTSYTVFEWANNQWSGNTRYVYEFDSENNDAGKVVQQWTGTEWKNDTHDTEYLFDEEGIFRRWSNYRWKNNQWLFDYYIYLDYNEKRLMSRKLSIRPPDINLSQVIYNYNDQGEYSEMYAQFWRNGNWENSWRRWYEYDACGNIRFINRQSWVNGEWINTTRSEFIQILDEKTYQLKKIPVCHNGHTIYVSKNAVPAHLRHGDCIGECLVEVNGGNNEKSLFIESSTNHPEIMENGVRVYPNPVNDKINIYLGINEQHIRKIELMDLSGRVLLQVPVNGESIITIPRGELQKGMYMLRMEGDEVVNHKIIIQ